VIRDLASHPSAYVTIREFADYLGVSGRQVRKWIAAGQLEVVRFGPRQARVTRVSALHLERTLSRLPAQPFA